MLIAVCSAVASLPIAWIVARRLQANSKWWIVVIAPLVVPAPLIGIGGILIWNHGWLGIYDSLAVVVLAMLCRFSSISAIIIYVRLKHLDPLWGDAGRLVNCGRFRRWWCVEFPLVFPVTLVGMAVVFAFTLGEIGATLILIPPGYNTLSIRIYNYLHYGASAEVAGLCLLIALCTIGMGGLAFIVLCRNGARSRGLQN